jgi:O-antigen/teichoic acid export membrane protein
MGISPIALIKSFIPRKGSFAANMLTLMTGTSLAQGLIIVASPILTRLYTPDDFGILAIYVSIVSLLLAVASWNYEWAIPLAETMTTAANLLLLCLGILAGMSLVALIGLWVMGDLLILWLRSPMLKPFLWLLPISLLGGGVYQILNQWAVRHKAYGVMARTKLSQSLGQVLTQVGLGFLKLGPLGLLLGDIIGRTTGSSTLARIAWRRDREALKMASLPQIFWAANRYRRFPLFFNGTILLNTTGFKMPFILLAAFYGPTVVGWFALGQRVLSIPISLMLQAASQVFFAEASRLVQTDRPALQRLFYKLAKKLTLVAIPIMLIALVSPWLIPIIFGEVWRQAGVYTQSLTLMYLTQIVASPTSQVLTVCELQHWRLLWDAGRVLFTTGGFLIAYSLDWLPTTCIFFYALLASLAYVALFFLSVYALKTLQKGAENQDAIV